MPVAHTNEKWVCGHLFFKPNTFWSNPFFFVFVHVAISGLFSMTGDSNSQVRDVQMPIRPIGNMNVAIGPMGIGDLVNLNARWENVYDDRIA